MQLFEFLKSYTTDLGNVYNCAEGIIMQYFAQFVTFVVSSSNPIFVFYHVREMDCYTTGRLNV